jgi:hypothetical protein
MLLVGAYLGPALAWRVECVRVTSRMVMSVVPFGGPPRRGGGVRGRTPWPRHVTWSRITVATPVDVTGTALIIMADSGESMTTVQARVHADHGAQGEDENPGAGQECRHVQLLIMRIGVRLEGTRSRSPALRGR